MIFFSLESAIIRSALGLDELTSLNLFGLGLNVVISSRGVASSLWELEGKQEVDMRLMWTRGAIGNV